jgi:hypothetical protein
MEICYLSNTKSTFLQFGVNTVLLNHFNVVF